MIRYLLIICCVILSASKSAAQVGIDDFRVSMLKVLEKRQKSFQKDEQRWLEKTGVLRETGSSDTVKHIPVYGILSKRKYKKSYSYCSSPPSAKYDSLFVFLSPRSLYLSKVAVTDGKSTTVVHEVYSRKGKGWARDDIDMALQNLLLSAEQSRPLAVIMPLQGLMALFLYDDHISCFVKERGEDKMRFYEEIPPEDLRQHFSDDDCFDISITIGNTKRQKDVLVY